MTHEKLVAGTESPTRYTKIIRNPGAGTKYNRRYQEAEFVSRYTKTVSPPVGDAPPPPPEPDFDPLVVAKDSGANWIGSNIYEVGQTVEGKTASFTGGKEPVVYRYRFQFKAEGSENWINGKWETVPNAKTSVFYECLEPGQVKLQSQARDAQDPVVICNSNTGLKNITAPPATEIGVVDFTVNEIELGSGAMTLLINDPVPAEGSFTGDADPSYDWSGRSEYPLMVGQQAKQTVLTFPQEGLATVMLTLADPTATDSPVGASHDFFIVDAETFEELKNKGEI